MTDDEMSMGRLTDLFDSVQAGMKSIEHMQQKWALLTATGTAAHKRVSVSVNAEGEVIETRFSGEIGDLSYEEIAKAVTEAAQAAMRELRRQTSALMAPVQDQDSRMPKLSELASGVPDILSLVPEPPRVSTAAPGSPERLLAESEAMEFADTEQIDGDSSQSGVTGPSW
ncbi:YbaB/EbfC family nucleoid-associated protein [Nocardia grenadensis]|uniref:YbaB/EbfC family nucleoid-associated protein n=1 Tax=Nocardia grenadensis TaxID=931537 RepID=UPI0007A47D20|nr:YbaB/EbfC family nucleoid-associated protein [Nocardia grenadensis]